MPRNLRSDITQWLSDFEEMIHLDDAD